MITFGYKSKFSSILRACAAAAIGLVMLINTDATVTVVKIVASFLFAAGVVTFAHGYIKRNTGALPLMSVNAIVDIVMGLLLFLFPHQVADFIPRLIGVALVIFGALQVIVLAGTLSLVGSGRGSMLLSVIALVGGILLVFSPFSLAVMKIIAGVFLLVYGVSEVLSMSRVMKAQEAYEIKFGQQNQNSGSTIDAEQTTYTSSSTSGTKIDTSGISDAKEVEFTKED